MTNHDCPKCGHHNRQTGNFIGYGAVICGRLNCQFKFTVTAVKRTETVFVVRCVEHEFGDWRDLRLPNIDDPERCDRPVEENQQVRVCVHCRAAEAREPQE